MKWRNKKLKRKLKSMALKLIVFLFRVSIKVSTKLGASFGHFATMAANVMKPRGNLCS